MKNLNLNSLFTVVISKLQVFLSLPKIRLLFFFFFLCKTLNTHRFSLPFWPQVHVHLVGFKDFLYSLWLSATFQLDFPHSWNNQSVLFILWGWDLRVQSPSIWVSRSTESFLLPAIPLHIPMLVCLISFLNVLCYYVPYLKSNTIFGW